MMKSNTVTVTDYYRCIRPGFYPWPHRANSKREILITSRDILMQARDGTYQSVNGMVCSGIVIPRDYVVHADAPEVIVMSGEII